MTFTPLPPFGTGGAVTATIDHTNENFGATTDVPNSPNFSSGETSTQLYEATLNVLNAGTKP